MSAEGIIVKNPKENKVDLRISFEGRDGEIKKYQTLKPGDACRCDKKKVIVEEIPRPTRLFAAGNGMFITDTVTGPKE